MDRRKNSRPLLPNLNHLSSMEEGMLLDPSQDEIQDSSKTNSEIRRRPGLSDRWNMALLVLLYAMQGVPLGLTLGSVPFILKTHASYTDIGIFSLASYPYSMKLLWSPIVDTVFWHRLGWRKSWVLPIQMAIGILMLTSASTAQRWLDETNVHAITGLFFFLVLLAATQDIAVDGWALTLLCRKNVGHASTCQTLGINTGYFLSFTIFLALNDASFCNAHLRATALPHGLVSLADYFRFWGCIYVVITLLLLLKAEKPYQAALASSYSPPATEAANSTRGVLPGMGVLQEGVLTSMARKVGDGWEDNISELESWRASKQEEGRGGWESQALENPSDGIGLLGTGERAPPRRLGAIRAMYQRLWRVAVLKNIRSLTTVLLLCKLGTITAEAAGVFKLMEKGVTRETISLIVLVEFPLELVFALFAGRWASGSSPFTPWLTGYFLRLATAAMTVFLVAIFPQGGTLQNALVYYVAIVATGITTSLASTLMFVSQGNFFARISDSSMGGTYLTLLNTIANLGSAWPKFFVFILIDRLTYHRCVGVDDASWQGSAQAPLACPLSLAAGSPSPCQDAGGVCKKVVDGFYLLASIMIVVGFIIGCIHRSRLRGLESARYESWRAL